MLETHGVMIYDGTDGTRILLRNHKCGLDKDMSSY